jgi:hypothetical protein
MSPIGAVSGGMTYAMMMRPTPVAPSRPPASVQGAPDHDGDGDDGGAAPGASSGGKLVDMSV